MPVVKCLRGWFAGDFPGNKVRHKPTLLLGGWCDAGNQLARVSRHRRRIADDKNSRIFFYRQVRSNDDSTGLVGFLVQPLAGR